MAEKSKNNLKLMSLSEFLANARRTDITKFLPAGFRVWMKTSKKQSLQSRTFAQWNKLFDEYLKS